GRLRARFARAGCDPSGEMLEHTRRRNPDVDLEARFFGPFIHVSRLSGRAASALLRRWESADDAIARHATVRDFANVFARRRGGRRSTDPSGSGGLEPELREPAPLGDP